MLVGTSFLGSPQSLRPPITSTTTASGRRRIIVSSFRQNPISTVTKLLWGETLPPNLLISVARFSWSSVWHLMMSQLAPSDASGSYLRPASQFRITTADPSLSCRKLHLYVALPCPWAHRTLIVRALKGLENFISVSIAAPGDDGSWKFTDTHKSSDAFLVPTSDKVNRCKTLKEVYNLRSGGYNGRSTVPMLWDCDANDVVCNESYDIIEIFNSSLNDVSENPDLDLSPPPLKNQIEKWNKIIYSSINNGVYRCGFAQSQEAYNTAVNELFTALDMVNDHLATFRFLCGDALTLADVCLFTTLIRFDVAYNVLFKCTKKKIIEYTNLHGYMREIYQIPKVAQTCNLDAIRDGYYKTLFPLNPGGISPAIPRGCEQEMLMKPHCRESLSFHGKSQEKSIV